MSQNIDDAVVYSGYELISFMPQKCTPENLKTKVKM